MKDFPARASLIGEDSDKDSDTVEQRVCRAADGDSCLDLLRGSRMSGFPAAFLLLDLNLRGLQGHDVLDAGKGDDLLKALPVIVVTTSSNPRDESACYRAGANAYHVKPLRCRSQLQVLNTLYDYWLLNAALPRLAPRAGII